MRRLCISPKESQSPKGYLVPGAQLVTKELFEPGALLFTTEVGALLSTRSIEPTNPGPE